MFEKTELEELRREVKVLARRVETLEQRLVERSKAEEELARRREVKRENQARFRAKKKAIVGATVVPTKEEKNKIEKVPPTPPIKRKEEKEEEIFPSARAREESGCLDGLRKKCETWAKAFWDAYPRWPHP